ncbi:MAG TPA: four helix bundle protein [Candidatus Omnitrophota bacterium]|nr:four helix bundle protein [Candidatus Omnitrophota bacterium]HPS36873.1 four helix bundle protein [Candidatus Omnitrophota bacterium]
MSGKGYKKLRVWEKGNEYALAVYRFTKEFPREELYGITSQLRRAALSVALNIVEGQASVSKKDFLNFLNIANRSLVESEYLLEFSRDLTYLSDADYEILERSRRELGLLLMAFIRGVRSKL